MQPVEAWVPDFKVQPAQPSFSPPASGRPPARVIISKKRAEGATLSAMGAMGAMSQEMGMSVVELAEGDEMQGILQRLNQRAEVRFAVEDDIVWAAAGSAGVPDDPEYQLQWGLPRVKAPEAWDLVASELQAGNAAPTVCIIDSGLDISQPDLVDNLHPLRGYSALTKDSNLTDGLRHGTHVAGVVGAVGDNHQFVAGMSWSKVGWILR